VFTIYVPMSYTLDMRVMSLLVAVVSCTGKIIKNGLGVFERVLFQPP